jgi:NAD(P)H-dependent FMN reductase
MLCPWDSCLAFLLPAGVIDLPAILIIREIGVCRKVLAIAGSPRRHGNSETLLDRALEGVAATHADAQIDKIVLNECDIRPCQNCGYCEKNGVCRFAESDDMGRIYELLETCDRFVLATPIFFANVSAQLKTMFDRCQPYWVRKFVRKEAMAESKRKALFLCVGGFDHDRFRKCARMVVKTWCICLDIGLANELFYRGIDRRGDIQKHSTALPDAFGAGHSLMI